MCQVKRRTFLGLSATILGGGLMAGKTGHGFENGGQGAAGSVHHHVHAVSVMTETANRFLAALSPEQRAKATFAVQRRRAHELALHPQGAQGADARRNDPLPEAPGERAAGGRPEPDRLHQGRHHHEPGRRAEDAGER